MNIDELQLTVGKKLASELFEKFIKTEEFENRMRSDLSFHEQKTLIVLKIYDRVQQMQLEKKINELAMNSKEELFKQLIDTLRDVQFFEVNLYSMTRLDTDNKRLNAILNDYYGMVPNEKLNLFQAIEEIVETNVFER